MNRTKIWKWKTKFVQVCQRESYIFVFWQNRIAIECIGWKLIRIAKISCHQLFSDITKCKIRFPNVVTEVKLAIFKQCLFCGSWHDVWFPPRNGITRHNCVSASNWSQGAFETFHNRLLLWFIRMQITFTKSQVPFLLFQRWRGKYIKILPHRDSSRF